MTNGKALRLHLLGVIVTAVYSGCIYGEVTGDPEQHRLRSVFEGSGLFIHGVTVSGDLIVSNDSVLGAPNGIHGSGLRDNSEPVLLLGIHGSGLRDSDDSATQGIHGSGLRGIHGSGLRGIHGSGLRDSDDSATQGIHGSGLRGIHGSGLRGIHGSGLRGIHGSGLRGIHGSRVRVTAVSEENHADGFDHVYYVGLPLLVVGTVSNTDATSNELEVLGVKIAVTEETTTLDLNGDSLNELSGPAGLLELKVGDYIAAASLPEDINLAAAAVVIRLSENYVAGDNIAYIRAGIDTVDSANAIATIGGLKINFGSAVLRYESLDIVEGDIAEFIGFSYSPYDLQAIAFGVIDTDGSAIQDGEVAGIHGSGLRGIHGSGLRGIDGSGLRGIHGSSLRGIHGSGLRGIHGSGLRGIHGSGLR